MTDKIIRVKIEAGDSAQQINQLDSSMVKLGASADKTTNEVTGLNTELTKTAAGVKTAISGTNDALGSFGRSAGQAGVQIQQFVGQVQGGVSPLVALSQQATDLGYVLGFPLLGAVVGIAAALGGPLVSAFIDSTDKAEEFKNKLKEIKDVQDDLKGVNLSIEISKLNTEYDKQTALIAQLKKESEQYQELVKRGGSSAEAYAFQLERVNGAMAAAREKQAELAKQQEELTAASLDNTAKTAEQDERIQSFNTTLALQKIRLEEGELAARLYAAAQLTGANSVAELDANTRQQITTIYELEQAQKAQKAASEELQRQVENELRQEVELAKQEQEKERRAERERQRINERIANMQLEAQTMASQNELMRAVRSEMFTAEAADLAAQTASRILAATSEFEQLMSIKGLQDQQRIDAEIAFREQLKAIDEQYALGQQQIDEGRYQTSSEISARIRDANLQSFASGVSILETFLGRSNAIVKAARIAMGAYQAFSIYASSQAAAAAALAPPPIGLGPIAGAGLAGAISTAGKVSAASVLAASVAGAFQGGGGSSFASAAGGSASTTTIPTAPQSAPMVGSIEILGLTELKDELRNQDGMVSTRFVASILDKIEDANRLRGNA